MDFKLTEEQRILQRTIREFAHEELKPLSRELDLKADPRECFSWGLVDKASELGLRTAVLPAEIGGAGLDLVTTVIALEELGTGDIGFASMFSQHLNYLLMVDKLCTKEQKDEFIPKIVEDKRFFLALGLTEPDHGTDNQLPYDAPGVALKTTAERKGDEYVINGTKQFITNGGIAKLYFIYARTNRELGITKSMSLFLVPHDTPGFSVGSYSNKLGRRLLMNVELVLEDVHIPARYLVGEENRAWGLMQGMRPSLLNTTACIIGGLREIYEMSLDYAKTRIQGGGPIIELPTIGIKLANMRAKIEAARMLLWKCAWSFDAQYEYDRKMNFLIKAFTGEIALSIINDAIEVFGGYGTDKDFPLEKYVRDIYTILHAYGNTTINLIKGMPAVT